MTVKTWSQGDAAKLIRDHLHLVLPGALYRPVEVVLEVPDQWKPRGKPPLLAVFDDGGPAAWPVITRPLIRLTAFAAGRTEAREVAALAQAVLLSRSLPGIAYANDPSSLLDSRDTKTGAQVSSCTVRVGIRTHERQFDGP